MKYPQFLSNLRVESKVCLETFKFLNLFKQCLIRFWCAQIEEILRNSVTSEFGGVYYYSERGDRLIDLDAFHEKLIQVACPFLCILVMFVKKRGQPGACNSCLRRIGGRVRPLWVLCMQPFPTFLQEAVSWT
jgi:hypothetical protein